MRDIRTITGLRVLSVEEGADLGAVSQVVVDLAAGNVLGIIVGSGSVEKAVRAEDIQTIGTDVVMISSRDVAGAVQEHPELAAHRREPVNPLGVFTKSGRKLGIVATVFIDPLDKVVTRYEVSAGPLKDVTDGILTLPVIDGTIHGQDAIILPDAAVAQFGREIGGLRAALGRLGETAGVKYRQAADGVEKVVESSSETLRKNARVAREKAAELSEQMRREKEETPQQSEAPEEAVEAAQPAPAEEAQDAQVLEQPEPGIGDVETAAPAEEEHEEVQPCCAETHEDVQPCCAETHEEAPQSDAPAADADVEEPAQEAATADEQSEEKQ